jgi:geranyl-CoA carboxylase alpha subunit
MKRLLIANRGEIAIRIARTARRMGIATVAVHSDADADMPHVRACDRGVRIGPAAARDSYLDIAAILDAAAKSRADAIHPGYGFLSENAAFARAAVEAGLIFVGPRARTIEAMGDKARARAIAAEAGVPVLAGHDGGQQDTESLAAEAVRIGLPVMVKAAAGGGGRGMRAVHDAARLADAIDSARREAEAAFGDGRLLLERLVEDARHVEVQVFGDVHGNFVHLHERDCSAQRRHQKLVEEAPSPALSDATREALTGDAIRLARAAGYVGAGTVEFVVGADGKHHFLEMNTRLQVEHPVTEAITGLDLVEWQLRVARGEALPLAQEDIRVVGHAIEARLCAEDAAAGFLPQTGRIVEWSPPAAVARVDAGVETGSVVSPHYDSMIAKVIVHGRDRAEAAARMVAALDATHVAGVATNRTFLRGLVGSDAFRDGAVTTSLVDGWAEMAANGADGVPQSLMAPRPDRATVALAAALLGNAGGDWFRSSGVADCPIDIESGGTVHACRLAFERGRLKAIAVDGVVADVQSVKVQGHDVDYAQDGVMRRAWSAMAGAELWLDVDGESFRFREVDYLGGQAAVADSGKVAAPLSGSVRKVHVRSGDRVEPGAPLLVIEAMKMETVVAARISGTVRAVHAAEGGQVAAGALLVEIEADARTDG